MYYGLDKNKNVYPISAEEANSLFENPEERLVRQTKIYDFWISTVFLVIDHGCSFLSKDIPPLLFETMIFTGESGCEKYQKRYTTWKEALDGHRRAVRKVIKSIREMEAQL